MTILPSGDTTSEIEANARAYTFPAFDGVEQGVMESGVGVELEFPGQRGVYAGGVGLHPRLERGH
jgi:hypothetical protein